MPTEDDEELAKALQKQYEEEAQQYARRQKATRAKRSKKSSENKVREPRVEEKSGRRDDRKEKKQSLTGKVRDLNKTSRENDHNVPNLAKDGKTTEGSSESKIPDPSNNNSLSLGCQKSLEQKDDEKGEMISNATIKEEIKPSKESASRKSSSRVSKKSKRRTTSKKDAAQGSSINVKPGAVTSLEEGHRETAQQYRRPKRQSNKVRGKTDVEASPIAPSSSDVTKILAVPNTDQKLMSVEKIGTREDVPDTSKDEELAKRLSQEINRGKGKRRPRRKPERLNNVNSEVCGSSSEKINQKTKCDSEAALNDIYENTKSAAPDTSRDEEIAKRSSDEVNVRPKPRSQQVLDQNDYDYAVREAPDTAKNESTNEEKEEEECTIPSLGTNAVARNEKNTGISKDEEFARQLAAELAAEATTNTASKQTPQHDNEEIQTVDIESIKRDNDTQNNKEESKLNGKKKIAEISKDEEFARQLAAELAAEATTNVASQQTPQQGEEGILAADLKDNRHCNEKENSKEESNGKKLAEISEDEEFAKQLAAELAAEATANASSKQTSQHENEGTLVTNGEDSELSKDMDKNKESKFDILNDDEVTHSQSKGTRKTSEDKLVACEHNKGANNTEDDEALAKRLEQELKDEEFARKLNEKEMKRRRRTNYLARKQASERRRAKEAKASNGNESTAVNETQNGRSQNASQSETHDCRSGIPSSSTTGNEKEKRSRSPTPIASNNIEKKCDERALNKDSREISPMRSRERSKSPKANHVSQKDSREISPKCSRERSMSPKANHVSHKDSREISPKRSRKPSEPTKRSHEISMSPKPNHATPSELRSKNLDQEKKDAELAMALANAPTRISVYHIPDPEILREQKKCTVKRVIPFLIIAVVAVGTVIGVVVGFTGGGGTDVPYGPYILQEEEDPFAGRGSSKWNVRGIGLRLVVQNALSDVWESAFSTAINEWEATDYLELQVEETRHDPACEAVSGVLKVCNANYGETKWRGLNQVVLQNNFIISSVAMLNEFYLRHADDDQRQYTMCHEIGHGFGLAHTDEDFYNEDLGDCMDYTSNPGANKSPSQRNFYDLSQLYGPKNRRSMIRGSNLNIKLRSEITPELRFRIDRARAIYETEIDDIFSGVFLHSRSSDKADYQKSEVISLGEGYELVINKLPVI
eukprot:CAMPEP_0194204784 /NCGR_PEP_ID=MMETSP0156-20130528/4223_1 /TAXON_ID=33649 /ORGANISM="Thalassionema nitzschioides, Strain L26-B" /LENGTH=1164 /DNA_ID=CAMNT_0038930891 /DNA_START=143 /DNA_END=3637 /DNA_ORIENTATION=-